MILPTILYSRGHHPQFPLNQNTHPVKSKIKSAAISKQNSGGTHSAVCFGLVMMMILLKLRLYVLVGTVGLLSVSVCACEKDQDQD